MLIIFSDQDLPKEQTKSVFLAGPSPRQCDVADWRHQALCALNEVGFNGTVFIPIPKNRFYADSTFEDDASWSYDGQIRWECDARDMADLILFWVPRCIDNAREDLGMPGFITNVEFGEDLGQGKVVYGHPPEAHRVSYLDYRARHSNLAVHESLQSCMHEVVMRLGAGAHRMGGAAQVPLFVWNTPMFQTWYQHLVNAGNRLDGARVLSHLSFGNPANPFVFYYALHVNIWVESEQRHKSNEILVARPDTSAVVAVSKDRNRVVLVREFRSPANNALGMIYEFPAGSCSDEGIAMDINAQHELHEETGLLVQEMARFHRVSCRQLAATFSTHQAHLYAIELTDEELTQLDKSKDTAFGDAAAGGSQERTYVEVLSMDEFYALPVDYSTIGMYHEALRVLAMVQCSDDSTL